ncbi:Hypothetical predicted protein [Marmota monax]|uniref:Uncharacterized protein n=1 Tax=Marmota monax TaxID=9995 RepID=A0A5E4CEW5_MARMO|nr:Hypothetical predicted protein [Marmota monax]
MAQKAGDLYGVKRHRATPACVTLPVGPRGGPTDRAAPRLSTRDLGAFGFREATCASVRRRPAAGLSCPLATHSPGRPSTRARPPARLPCHPREPATAAGPGGRAGRLARATEPRLRGRRGGGQAGRFRFRAWPRRLPAVTEAADWAPARGGAPGFASLGRGAVPRSARVGLPERWREAVTVPELAAGWRRARRTAAGDGAGPGPRRPGPTGCRSTRTGWTCGSSCSWTCCSSSSCTFCPDGFADIPRSLDCGVNSENELQSS